MIVYLNQRNYTQSRYIERQKEFGLGNFFNNIFRRAPKTPIKPVTSTAPRIKGRVGSGDLHGGTVTPVVPKTVNVAGTNVKVSGNMPIQSQAQQFLDSGQVQAAQRNSATPSRNSNNKKSQKQNQLLDSVPVMKEIANAGGNTLVIGAKNTKDITAAVNNANNGVVGRVKGGANGDKIINQNAYQGQVATKEVPKQQGTGATAADIKQAKITQDKFNRFQESQTAQQALKDRLATAKSNGSLQNFQQQKQVNAVTSVTARDASRNTKLSTKVENTKPTTTPAVENKPAIIENKPQGQGAQGQGAQGQQQTPPPPSPMPKVETNSSTSPANNNSGKQGGGNNNTSSTNQQNSNENKPNWWNRWGRKAAIGTGVTTAAVGGAGIYGLHKLVSDDDE